MKKLLIILLSILTLQVDAEFVDVVSVFVTPADRAFGLWPRAKDVTTECERLPVAELRAVLELKDEKRRFVDDRFIGPEQARVGPRIASVVEGLSEPIPVSNLGLPEPVAPVIRLSRP